MFTSDDIAVLKGMFKDFKGEMRVEMRDEISIQLAAVEKRWETRMKRFESGILHGVAEILDVAILPQISGHDRRLTRVERRVGIV